MLIYKTYVTSKNLISKHKIIGPILCFSSSRITTKRYVRSLTRMSRVDSLLYED